MLRRALPLIASLVLVVGGCKGEPDYVAEPRPIECDTRSRLFRQGYPENLEPLVIGSGSCTVTREENVRGPDDFFTAWLSIRATPWTSCDGPVEVWFWTEPGPDGEIVRTHFCPDFCEGLKRRLLTALANDVVCPDAPAVDSGVAGSGAGAGAVAPVAGFTGSFAGAAGAQSAGASGNASGIAGSAGLPASAGGGAGGAGIAASAGAGSGAAAGAGSGAAAGAAAGGGGVGGAASSGGTSPPFAGSGGRAPVAGASGTAASLAGAGGL